VQENSRQQIQARGRLIVSKLSQAIRPTTDPHPYRSELTSGQPPELEISLKIRSRKLFFKAARRLTLLLESEKD
jgi:hypothetical protein